MSQQRLVVEMRGAQTQIAIPHATTALRAAAASCRGFGGRAKAGARTGRDAARTPDEAPTRGRRHMPMMIVKVVTMMMLMTIIIIMTTTMMIVMMMMMMTMMMRLVLWTCRG